MLKGGSSEEEGGTGPTKYHNTEEVECTSSSEGGIYSDRVLEGHNEGAVLPLPNEVNGQKCLAANLGQRNVQRDERASHWGHTQRCSSLH